jgi:hypothetical protein
VEIAVIIPLFDGAAWIRETLDSVLAQRLLPREIIVVDDCSRDDSPRIAAGYPGVRLLRTERTSGPVVARTLGLVQTATPLVAFLDQDDTWHPAHLELTSEALRESPASAAAVGRQTYFTDAPSYDSRPGCDALDPWRWFPLDGAISTPSAVLLRRDALDAVGGWHHGFAGVADLHLWLRLASRHPLRLLHAATTGRRRHARSLYDAHRTQPLHRMRLRCAAMSHAARMRLRACGDDAQLHATLMACVAFYGHVVLLVEALLAGDRCSAALAAALVGGIVEHNLGHPGLKLFAYLEHALGPRWPALGAALLSCWPAEHARSARMLEERLTRAGAGSALEG